MWRKVQVLRPRTSRSGGQSSGRVVACGAVRVVEGGVGGVVLVVSFLVMAAQAAKEVQERQLCSGIVSTYTPARSVIRAGHTVSHQDPELRPWV